ncbi:DinB family protein [Synechocystis sp. B12]|nr:DinB family protein [Synechocystis sp. B12]
MVENLETIDQAMERCRTETLRLLHRIPPTLGDRQWHPDFSPIDWHFGHIAFTEALWLLPEQERKNFIPRLTKNCSEPMVYRNRNAVHYLAVELLSNI